MEYNNPTNIDYIIATSGEKLKCKIIEIGAWNMDNNATMDIPHGLGSPAYMQIYSITGIIQNDAQDKLYIFPRSRMFGGVAVVDGSIYEINSVNIRANAITGLFFDSPDFDSVAINRGWFCVWYTE